jgi:hypothetical protein
MTIIMHIILTASSCFAGIYIGWLIRGDVGAKQI